MSQLVPQGQLPAGMQMNSLAALQGLDIRNLGQIGTTHALSLIREPSKTHPFACDSAFPASSAGLPGTHFTAPLLPMGEYGRHSSPVKGLWGSFLLIWLISDP